MKFKIYFIIYTFFLVGSIAIAHEASTVSTGCISGDCINGFGKFMYANNDIYEGNFVNGKLEGEGVYTQSNGEIYLGTFKAGLFDGSIKHTLGEGTFIEIYKLGELISSKKVEKTTPELPISLFGCVSGNCQNGYGKYAFDNGNSYEGDFINGKKAGLGVFTFKSGEKYNGQFVNDVRNGKGFSSYDNGDTYTGDFANDLREGQGDYTFKNGDFYTGEWKNNTRNGYGKQVNKATNAALEGTWQNDVFITPTNVVVVPQNAGCISGNCENGFGKYLYESGNIYEGNFVNNLQNGTGKVTYTNGNIYEGEWLNGYRTLGTMTFKEGATYSGSFGEKGFNGKGKLIYINGEIYEGDWVDDKKNGKGKSILANGDIYDGSYSNNVVEGQGTYTTKKGEIYSGQFTNGQPNGYLIYTGFIDTYEGNWVNGIREGKGKLKNNITGNIVEGNWKNDILEGKDASNTNTPITEDPKYVLETVNLLMETLNGKFDIMEGKSLTYVVTMKKTGEVFRYKITFEYDDTNFAFRWRENSYLKNSERLVLTSASIISAKSYTNFYTLNSGTFPSNATTFILSRFQYDGIKYDKKIRMKLAAEDESLILLKTFSLPMRNYAQNAKLLDLQTANGKTKMQVLDNRVCPLVVFIETDEYTLDLQ